MKSISPIVTLFLVVVGTTQAFVPLVSNKVATPTVALKASSVSSTDGDFYIDEQRRTTMNVIMVGAGLTSVAGFGVPFLAFFVPPGVGGSNAGAVAKDEVGNDVTANLYLNSKPAGDRSLVQGLKGDATYLIVMEDKTFESYGLNAVCTHLGCVVPWSASANKFQCPCHGSQYAPDGSVVRGPAPLPLALAHVNVDPDSNKVVFTPWLEEDFRTGEKGWWN